MIDVASIAIICSVIALFSLLGSILLCGIIVVSRTGKLDQIVEDIDKVRYFIEDWMDAGAIPKKESVGMTTYQSSDGKYRASSLEELLEMMTSDPDSNIPKNDVDALKRIFEQISSPDDDDTELDDEQHEDEDEEWKR